MPFIAFTPLLLAALAAATPSSPLQDRQAPSVLATFYTSGGCNQPNDIIQRVTLTQDTAPCHNLDPAGAGVVGCTEFTASTLTRPIQVGNGPDCMDVNNYVFNPDIPSNNKFAQDFQSYRFI